MSIIFTFLGIVFALLVAYIFSFNRKAIDIKKPIIMIAIQIVLVLFMMNTSIGLNLLTAMSTFFEGLMNISKEGIEFVFGDLQNKNGYNFFLNVLLPLVFISVLIGMLNYFKILPFLIKIIGWIINKITQMGQLESYIAISTSMLGQPEVYLTVKNIIPSLSKEKLYTITTSGMSAVSMAMLGSYMQMIDPKYVVTAVVLNIFSALIIASVINPYKNDNKEVEAESEKNVKKTTFFQMISESAIDGFKIAITVAIMLLAFI
ncbi:MAG: NupC/NupG family nucleoside CNT transporter, partial [Gemella sp.]